LAHDRAKATGASVVFHVSRPPAVVSDGDPLLSAPPRGGGNEVRDELRKLQATDPAVQVEREVIVAVRPDAAHIRRVLHERGCDLLVMGTHGRTGLLHRLSGSVTEDVVRKAHCPEMLVKALARVDGPSTHQDAGKPESRFEP
jgi:nucleotide-binding universal stress UspA family protein